LAVILRSIVFNVAFYLNLLIYFVLALPTFAMSRHGIIGMATSWGRTNLWLLRVICGLKVEVRGRENIPPGAVIVAAKHQSAWETFALLSLFADPAFILKRELLWLPVFGWYARRAEMIPVDRSGQPGVMEALAGRVRGALDAGRQIIIFPEGTRRAAGAPPRYKFGVAQLYRQSGAACLPVALNSGLFWPRRSFLRLPGTVVVEVLPVIPPGLDRAEFFRAMQARIEETTARLVEEGRRELAARGIAPPVADDGDDAD